MTDSLIAVCLGGAQTVWEDLAAALDLVGDRPHIIVACNYAGIQYDGHLDAWATLHPERFTPWREERAQRGLNTDYRAIVHARIRQCRDVEIVPERWSGSSGIYMAQVALEALGATHVILCGAPMDAEGMHIHWPGIWPATALYRPGYERAKDSGAAIRSMSGWSAGLFGQPNSDWLNGIDELSVDFWQEGAGHMWINMTRTHSYRHPEDKRVRTKYLAQKSYLVKRNHGLDMVARGHAVEIAAPNRAAAQALSPPGASSPIVRKRAARAKS